MGKTKRSGDGLVQLNVEVPKSLKVTLKAHAVFEGIPFKVYIAKTLAREAGKPYPALRELEDRVRE